MPKSHTLHDPLWSAPDTDGLQMSWPTLSTARPSTNICLSKYFLRELKFVFGLDICLATLLSISVQIFAQLNGQRQLTAVLTVG